MVWVMAKEKNFENKIKDFLKENKCWFIKYWGGGFYTKDGTPDILCCCKGRFIAIEVKAPDGKPTLIQCQKLKQINDAGGYAILLYPEQWHCFENFIWCIRYGDFRNADLNYEGILQPVWIEWLRKLKGQD